MIAAATARALGRLALSWLAVAAAAFALPRLMPGDPVEVFLAHANIRSGPETVAAYRTQWGLDGSLASQFGRWLIGFANLDCVSFKPADPSRPISARPSPPR